MTDAEQAVREAAANIPAEVGARFETAENLSDDDRTAILAIARHSLARFQARSESNPEARAEPDPEPQSGLETRETS